MIQIKVFTGTLEEIVTAFNAWAASLATGTQFPQGIAPSVRLTADSAEWIKEVLYVLPQRPNNGIAVALPSDLGRVRHGEPS